MRYVCFFVAFGALSVFSGCESPRTPPVVREDLFVLDIGRLEDQIALYDLAGDRGTRRTDLAMRDGLFYISDGSGGKIIRYNSYGDLLFMIYNEGTNPPPLTLKPLEEDSVVTRWAVPYPLMENGEIAVDSRKHIYVRDRLPDERHGFDSENKALLESIILHFDADGRFVEYLGQDGIGGTPFPRIEGIFSSQRDELAVVCRIPAGWNVYWYGADGTLLFLVQLRNDAIPVPRDRDLVIPSLDGIAAAPDGRKLFIKVDYYRDTFDESTATRTGNEPDSSMIWIMDVEKEFYEKTLEIPFFEYTYMEKNRRITTRMPYSMMGVVRSGRIFFYFPVENGYSLLIMSPEPGSNNEQWRGFIQVDNTELQFNAFDLSSEGILSALLVDDWQVKVVWWRTDQFIGEGIP
jgi:hypothetical protein